ncbi:hypothetical protein [Litorimonas haliclonae]|uniref:hypothetical protein n=1 Tax=Litorimonas haliclonae TaxID=2081977 RepID=UPI0039EED6EE
MAGFIIICLVGLLARYLNGSIYSQAEVLSLFDNLQQSGLYLGSATMASSGTTLALMLTMVGLVRRIDKDFSDELYRTVALIGLTSAIGLISSVILLLTLSLPIGEFEKVPEIWYYVLYNVTFGLIIFVSAISVSIVLILLQTVLHVIRSITPTDKA